MNFAITLSILFFSVVGLGSTCEVEFKNSNAIPGQNNCTSICVSRLANLATYICTLECERFCKIKSKKECALNPFWEKVVDAEGPPFKKLSITTKERVQNFLKTLPEHIQPKSLAAIVQASVQPPDMIGNPATTTGNYIVLLPSATRQEFQLERILFHEISHHMIKNEWLTLFNKYKVDFGWDKGRRKGSFIELDGLDSPEEDLVNNLEYFVFEKTKLTELNPLIKTWIDKKFKTKLNLREKCNEKK